MIVRTRVKHKPKRRAYAEQYEAADLRHGGYAMRHGRTLVRKRLTADCAPEHGRWQGFVRRAMLIPVLAAVLAGATACANTEDSWLADANPKSKYIAGDVNPLNYTPFYIHRVSIKGPGEIGGGGGNVMPVEPNGHPSTGGGRCCMTFPRQWQSDLRITVRWLMDKAQDGKTPGYWYKAENVRFAQYNGNETYGAWAIFLPGDRVKLMVADGNANGQNSVSQRPAEDDPDVFQGVRDDEWNLKYRRGGLQ
ncbi:DUF3304 domain-containing protein [Cupriavidus sp. CP313]